MRCIQFCWFCGELNKVYCLATDKSYIKTDDGYEKCEDLLLLPFLTHVPKRLYSVLSKNGYYQSYSKTVNSEYIVNHCNGCKQIQGDHFLHEKPDEAFFNGLFYKDATLTRYSKIKNHFLVPILASIPNYDEQAKSLELLKQHIEDGVENMASLCVDQIMINQLLSVCDQKLDIDIEGL